ncbi:MAG TPA: threonylcarbamoyl-AMP synthase, partial [Planctomycetaceae bacterium]|nr:threonylcarbamoyl-AMP synthase [Planctomycetaceae bacterium]
VKGRPRLDPIIVHVADVSWLGRVVAEVPELAWKLAERFWPGPLTLVLPKTENIPDIVTAGLKTCGVRAPDHPLAQELLRRADVPIAAPSANRFGQLSPTRAEHVQAQLADRIDLILDGGPCRIGVESTVLELTGDRPRLLRPGGVTWEELEKVAGPVAVAEGNAGGSDKAPLSPGQFPQHYAPRTPLVVLERLEQLPVDQRVGLITLGPVEPPRPVEAIEVLSPHGDLVEAAANFFAALHRLDASNLDRICALPFPDRGLGRALNDRLRRAAQGSIARPHREGHSR